MVTPESITKLIKQRKGLSKIGVFFVLIMFSGFATGVCVFASIIIGQLLLNDYHTSGLSEQTIIIFFIGMGIILAIDTIVLWRKCLSPEAKEKNSIDNDPLMKAFKTPAQVASIINNLENDKAVYESLKVKLTKDYLIDFDNPCSLMRLDDIVESKPSYLSDESINSTSVIVTDCFDRTFRYSIEGDYDTARHLDRLIHKYSKRLEEIDDSVVTKL